MGTGNSKTGLVYAENIKECRRNVDELLIYPYREDQAKGIGYNLSPSEIIVSTKKKGLVPIQVNDDGTSYVFIQPHETVLIVSHEYIVVKDNIAGTFHSRVRISALGIGNVSTTLDPNWKGRLLFAITNPTDDAIQLPIEKKINGIPQPQSILTMVTWRIKDKPSQIENAEVLHIDNPPMRVDILNDMLDVPNDYFPWGNRRYKELQQVIKNVREFKAKEEGRIRELNTIISLIISVQESIERKDTIEIIRSKLPRITERIGSLENVSELQDKYSTLRNIITGAESTSKLTSDSSQNIELIIKECHYLILEEEVNQQNQYIKSLVKQEYNKGKLWKLFNRHIKPNIGRLVIVLIWVATYLIVLKFTPTDYADSVTAFLVALLPLLTVCQNAKKGG